MQLPNPTQSAAMNLKLVEEAEAMKRSNETLRRQADLLELSHDAILIRKVDGAITFWNRGAERPLAEAKSLGFETRFPGQPLMVNTDRRMLSQIVFNMESNAIKFTSQSSVRLERLNAGSREEGPGLGLHLCRKLATLIGGRIEMESEFGRSSRFILVMPTAAGSAGGTH